MTSVIALVENKFPKMDLESHTPPVPSRVSKPIDRVETPIIACNDNFPNRIRRPSTPNKAAKERLAASLLYRSSVEAESTSGGREGRDEKKKGSRVRSVSAGRDHKSEMCSRYWTYLFENLERSISEIYEGCEKEENLRQCKEVVLILENYTRDFRNLIEWFNLKWTYEKTPPPMRPTALAWEIRKPSFCLLPHTRAYEKLLGLRESKSREIAGSETSSDTLESIGLIINPENLCSSDQCSINMPHVCEDNNYDQIVQPNPTSIINDCVPNCEKTDSNCVLSSFDEKMVDIALQTDFPEDPDVYYIAGGRSIAFQTDYTVDYPPLTTIEFKSSPIIINLWKSKDSNNTETNSVNNSNSNNKINSENVVAVTDTDTALIDGCKNSESQISVEICEFENPPADGQSNNNNSNATSIVENNINTNKTHSNSNSFGMLRPTTPTIETKSSATQLSVGVLIADENSTVGTGTVDTTKIKTIESKSNGSSSPVNKSLKDVSSSSTINDVTSPRSTFAEKAKNGMLRQNQGQTKSVSSFLNKVGVPPNTGLSNVISSSTNSRSLLSVNRPKTTGSAPGGVTNVKLNTSGTYLRGVTTGGGKSSGATMSNIGGGSRTNANQLKSKVAAPILNYRSNIASRCRTAVNTGQAPELLKSAKDKLVKSSAGSPSSSTASSTSSSAIASLAVSTISTSGDHSFLMNLSSSCDSHADAANANNACSDDSIIPKEIKDEHNLGTCGEGGGDCNANSKSGTTTTETALGCKKIVKIISARKNASPSPTIAVNDKVKAKQLTSIQQSQMTNALRQGIIRSKSMINPQTTCKSQNLNGKELLNDKSGRRLQGGLLHGKRSNNNGNLTPSGSFRKLHSNSYISLPDETAYHRRSHTVDEDGWETVKARSNRSKWSSSNSSLGSSNANQSRNSIDKGIVVVSAPTLNNNNTNKAIPPANKASNSNVTSATAKTITQKTAPGNKAKTSETNNSTSKKIVNVTNAKSNKITEKQKSQQSSTKDEKKNVTETINTNETDSKEDDENTVDEEEIKRKEADLDDAMREEELIEEELRQVEKDFERIENENGSTTEEGTITDSEHALSPDPEAVDAETEEIDDQLFFVSMDDQETAAENLPPRESGRILSFREKLMSPAKKCDGAETLKRYEAKLAKAERNREKLLQSKFNRYVELSERFEALNETTKKLVGERAELIAKAEERRKRAEEKRQQFLKSIRRKAHDEDSKAKEIAFINLLEAENKRHDYFASAQEAEERLQTIQEERRLKLEERAGKASQVIERQTHIRKDWQSKLRSLQEKRRRVHERITREKEEKAKERSEMAQEKARDREERISALNAAKQAEKEELQKKIRQKQEDTARRHEENMENIRQKAIELGTPRVQEENAAPSTIRICTLCKVIIQSEIHEMQHVRGRAHLDAVKKMDKLSSTSPLETSIGIAVGCSGGLLEGFGLKFIADIPADKVDSQVQPDRNRYKAVKKHSKKLMQKLIDSGLEFEKVENIGNNKSNIQCGDAALKSRTRKNILELERLVALFTNNKGSFSTATTMDRLMGDIRKASVQNLYIKDGIISMNGLDVGIKVLQCTASDLPVKTKIAAVEMIHGFIVGCLSNALYILRSTGICVIMNLCAERWNILIPDDNRWLSGSPAGTHPQVLPTDDYIESIVALLQSLMTIIPDPYNGISKKGSYLTQNDIQAIRMRTFDIIGYLVASGVIDRISVYCGGVRGPVDNHPAVSSLLRVFLDLLVVLVYSLQFCWGENPKSCIMIKKEPDGTQLLASLESSELAGAVSMSYSLLLHQGAPSRPRTINGNTNTSVSKPSPPGNETIEVVKCTLCLINAMARLDILALQNVLGTESVSLQFRHIASQLLWQVVPHREIPQMRRLLTELIISIGNFTVGNLHNQTTIQSGQTPTVLQLLCTLPKEFFTDPKLKYNFFATLLAATKGCAENREILVQNNIDVVMLDNYLHSEDGKTNVIIKRMNCITEVQSKAMDVVNCKSSVKKSKNSKKGIVKPLEESNNMTNHQAFNNST